MEMYRVLVFFILAILVTYFDLRYRLIPDKLNFLGLLLGLPYFQNLLWLLFYGLVMLLVAVVSKEALGGGDVKYIAVMALYLGSRTWEALFLGSVFFCLAALPLLILKKMSWQESLPFGPFLAAGGIYTLLGGGNLWPMILFSS